METSAPIASQGWLPPNQFDLLEIISQSETETITLGRELACRLNPGAVVALLGDLGTGKTCLTRGICAGLGVINDVTSPSFTLLNVYQGKWPVYHFDFYRIEREIDLFSLGLDEYLYGVGICIMEWADRAQRFLPEKRIEIRLEAIFNSNCNTERRINIISRNCKI